MKKVIGSTIVIFIIFSLIDYLVHGQILASTYQDFAHLWRPMDETKMGVMNVVTLIIALGFTLLYKWFVGCQEPLCATKFGLLLGFIAGVCTGFGSYSYMPISFGLAMAWFFTSWIQFTLAGVAVGLIIKDEKCCS